MTCPQFVVGTEKIQSENLNQNVICRLCLSTASYTDSEVIGKLAKEVLEFLPNVNLEKIHKHRICKVCNSKLFGAWNFKSTCMHTEDIISPLINASNASVIDLTEVYLMVHGNIQLTGMWENQRICRLCLQLVTHGFVSLNEVANDILDTYIPLLNITVTKDPIICGPCFDSLCTHGGFVKNCFEAQEEKYECVDKQPYIKTERIETQLNDVHKAQEIDENNDSYITFEEIKIKFEDDHDALDITSEEMEIKSDEGHHDILDIETIDTKQSHNSADTGKTINKCETKVQINKCKTYESKYKRHLKEHQLKHKDPSEIQMYKCDACGHETKTKGEMKSHQIVHKRSFKIQMYRCDTCTYETKYKNHLKRHQLTHKDPSEVQMYKCDTCTYQTKYMKHLKVHQLIHKDASELKMYRCEACDYEAKRKGDLKSHQLTHKDPSEIQMYRCDACNYEAKRKGDLKIHLLLHEDPLEIEMYKCDICFFETKYKTQSKNHQLRHKDPSEIQMYKCDVCDYETKYRKYLKKHQLTHKNPSEMQMYKCDSCAYESKYKKDLKVHQLTHKGTSEIQMYRCDPCDYETRCKSDLRSHLLLHEDPLGIESMTSLCVVGREKMQSENTICRLCISAISYTDSEVIEVAKEVSEVFPNLSLEEIHKHRVCKMCNSKLFAAFNFKLACMQTEAIIYPLIDASNGSVIDLKEVYVKMNENIHLADTRENQRFCRLCLQQVTQGFLSLNEVDNNIIDTYTSFLNISATKDPIICRPCFDSLSTHGDFVRNSLETLEKYKSTDTGPYIKTEGIEIKQEDGHDAQDAYQNFDRSSYTKFEESKIKLGDDLEKCKSADKDLCIKSEVIEIKSEEGDQDNDFYLHNLNEETIENKSKDISEDIGERNEYMLECETKVQINECESLLSVSSYKNICKRTFEGDLKYKTVAKQKYSSEIEMYKCDMCIFETKFKGNLKIHQVIHKDTSEIELYKCDICTYETKYKRYLKSHQLTHKGPSEIQMYKCDKCNRESKRKGALRVHQLTHKDPSEIQMYKCDICTYESKYKRSLKDHQIIHKDPSQIQMYKCDKCDYKSKRKDGLRSHQLTHKDPSEIQMHRCNTCGHETKRKGELKIHLLIHKNSSEIQMYKCDACEHRTKTKSEMKSHQLVHKDPSEIQMYKCDTCTYESKYKRHLKIHQLTHKDPSEIQMYKCDVCTYESKYKSCLRNHQLLHEYPSEIQT